MGVPRRALADGEQVVYQARPHWMALGWPLVWVVLLPLGLVVLVVTVPGTPVQVAEAVGAVTGLMALWLCGRVLRWLTSSLAVTGLRVIERTGVLSRRGTEIRLDRIAELSTHQSLLALALGGGQLVIETGAGEPAVLDHVRRPARVQGIVTEQLARRERRSPAAMSGWQGWAEAAGSPTPPAGTLSVASLGPFGRPGAPDRPGGLDRLGGPEQRGDTSVGASVAERLATLAELHRRGLVDDEELAAKRADILRQL